MQSKHDAIRAAELGLIEKRAGLTPRGPSCCRGASAAACGTTSAAWFTRSQRLPHHFGMDRRRFLLTPLTGALAIPFGAEAQAENPRPPVIGSIASRYRSHWASGGRMAHLRPAFEDGLRDAGYVAGQDVIIDYRFAEGDQAKLLELTAALIARSVEVLVAHGPDALRVTREPRAARAPPPPIRP